MEIESFLAVLVTALVLGLINAAIPRRSSMKVLAVNGSPRKTWNISKLLHEVLKDAAIEQGALP